MEHSLQTGANMPLDARLAEEIERAYLYEWWRIEEAVRRHEVDKVHKAPFVGDIVEMVYLNECQERRLNLIDAAIKRKDHQMLGFSSVQAYMEAVFSNQFRDPALDPHINSHELQEQVLTFLLTHQFMFIDYNHKLRNVPILEVW